MKDNVVGIVATSIGSVDTTTAKATSIYEEELAIGLLVNQTRNTVHHQLLAKPPTMTKKALPPHLTVALTNWTSRLLSIGLQLATVPLLTRSLGYGDYAAYAVTVSLMSWFALADFGVGGTLQNLAAKARVQKSSIADSLGASFVLMCSILLIGGGTWLLLSPSVGHFLLAELPLSNNTSKTIVVAVAGIFLLGNGIGVVGTKLLYATGQGVMANVITAVTSLLSFIALWITLHNVSSNLLSLAVACYVVPLGGIGAAVALFSVGRYASFSTGDIKRGFQQLWRPSSIFWLYASLGAAVHSMDYLIMSRTLQSEEISKYNILYRIFWVGMTFYIGLLMATWSHITELRALGKFQKVMRTLYFTSAGGFAGTAVFTIALLAFSQEITAFLFPNAHLTISNQEIVLFATYIAIRIWSDTHSIALQAIGEAGKTIKFIPVQAAISITLQILLSQHLGMKGIVLGLIASHAFTATWILPLQLRRSLFSNSMPKSA